MHLYETALEITKNVLLIICKIQIITVSSIEKYHLETIWRAPGVTASKIVFHQDRIHYQVSGKCIMSCVVYCTQSAGKRKRD